MMRRTSLGGWACGLLLLALGAVACGGGREHNGGGGGGGAEGGSGGAGATGGGGVVCSTPQECEYPSLGLEFTEVEGFSVTDATTLRTLPLLARIPTGEQGPLPVVIFSHGGGTNDNGHHQSPEWGATFAEHGYVAIHIAHSSVSAESAPILCQIANIPDGQCALPAGDEDANGFVALVKSLDIQTVLDKLPELSQMSQNQGGPALDVDRVAVAGWSGGSRGPVVLSGATFIPLPGLQPIGFRDERVKAAIALSPAGAGFGGFYRDADANTWETMVGPVLIMTGENDQKPDKPELTGEIRREAFDYSATTDNHWMLYSNLPVGVGEHGTYNLGDLDSSDARLSSLSLAETSAARAFLDAIVLDDAEARAWLDSGKAGKMAGEAEWLHR